MLKNIKINITKIVIILLIISFFWFLFTKQDPEKAEAKVYTLPNLSADCKPGMTDFGCITELEKIDSSQIPDNKELGNLQEIVEEKKDEDLNKIKKEMVDKINAYSLSINSPLGDKYGDKWVEIGYKYNRHPFALVAIAVADTSLGKHLTTPYNLGNVGNTDSCPTCGTHTKSWEDGIEAIAQTLTNKYLKNANKLCHLSRGGWKDCPDGRTINHGYFYASSEKNWNRNTNYIFSYLLGTEYTTNHLITIYDN